DTDTIAITVNPVNDPPVNTVPGAQSVAEDTALPIAGVSVVDIDSSALTTTLNVSSGTLNVTAGGGAGVSGNDSASVTITGTAAQINTALAGLAYTGNLNFNGGDTLTVATSDGTATDTASVTLTGTAAQITAALAGLAYTGNLNFNGGDTLTVVTGDGTATDTDTVAITVNAVNDPPVNTVPGAQSVAEDTA